MFNIIQLPLFRIIKKVTDILLAMGAAIIKMSLTVANEWATENKFRKPKH